MNQRNNSTCDFQVISFTDQINKSSYSPITSSHSTHPTCTPLVRLHHHVKSENQSVSISRRITSSGENPAQQSPKKNVKVWAICFEGSKSMRFPQVVRIECISCSGFSLVHPVYQKPARGGHMSISWRVFDFGGGPLGGSVRREKKGPGTLFRYYSGVDEFGGRNFVVLWIPRPGPRCQET